MTENWTFQKEKSHHMFQSWGLHQSRLASINQEMCKDLCKTRFWAKSLRKWRITEEIVLDTWGVVGEGVGRERKRSLWRQHTKAGREKDFLATHCSLSFPARAFEQKLTVQRNPLLAPLHFHLLCYSLLLHLGPSHLHNEKRSGGEEGQAAIATACLVSLYCK